MQQWCSRHQTDVRDPRNTAHAEMKSFGIGGRYVALVVGRFGEFFEDFVKLRNNIARQRAYAYTEHFNTSVNKAMSMFKLRITSRWALMAVSCWVRFLLDCRRDSINDRSNRAAAAKAPLDGAQERLNFRHSHDKHTRRISPQRSGITHSLFLILSAYDLAPSLEDSRKHLFRCFIPTVRVAHNMIA